MKTKEHFYTDVNAYTNNFAPMLHGEYYSPTHVPFSAANDLAKAVHAVHKGIYQLDPSVAGKVFASLAQPHNPGNAYSHSPVPTSPMVKEASTDNPHPAKPSALTGREIEVLRLIAKGATNREIAENLVISEGTVKNHISSILSHLGLRDRTQAAMYARESGLL